MIDLLKHKLSIITDTLSSSSLTDADKNYLSSGINVLDLACGNCPYWFMLYRQIHFKQITGIDIEPPEMISFYGKDEKISENNVIAGSYQHYVKECKLFNEEISINENDFLKIFQRNPDNLDIYKYTDKLIASGKKFDLVILSNVIHLDEPDKQTRRKLLMDIHKIISPNGFLYIHAVDDSIDDWSFSEIDVINSIKPLSTVVRRYPSSTTYSILAVSRS